MINPNWSRWITASFANHFEIAIDAAGLPFYIEGDERARDEVSLIEFRIDGPLYKFPAASMTRIDVEVNILIKTIIDRKDLYLHERHIGIVSEAFINAIAVNRVGPDAVGVDDGTLLGCFKLRSDFREILQISKFGIIRGVSPIMQTTVEGHYRLDLTNC
jgi:hypothetical protein